MTKFSAQAQLTVVNQVSEFVRSIRKLCNWNKENSINFEVLLWLLFKAIDFGN